MLFTSLPYPFRAPCCHSFLLGLIIPIAGFVIFLTNTLVFCVLSRVKIPSLWLCTINLFRRSSYVCSCNSPVCTRYTILSILSTIVMSTLPEALRLVLWYLSLWASACLYKARRSLSSVRRHLLNLAKTCSLLFLGCNLLMWSTLTIVLCLFLHVVAGIESCYVRIYSWKCWLLCMFIWG